MLTPNLKPISLFPYSNTDYIHGGFLWIFGCDGCEILYWLERGETFFIRVWKPLFSRRATLEGYPERASSKRIISTSGRLMLLQMVSKPNTEWCASVDARSPKEVDCEITHWLERWTKHSL